MHDEADADLYIGQYHGPRKDNIARRAAKAAATAADQRLAEELAAEKLTVEVESKKDMIRALGADTFDQHTVIRFDKRFEGTDTVYTYAAIKIGSRWYLTGSVHGSRFTWDELMLFLVSGSEPTTTFEVLALA